MHLLSSAKTSFKTHLFYLTIGLGISLFPIPAHAIAINVQGKISGTDIDFEGVANVGLTTGKGSVSVKLSTGGACKGNVETDRYFKGGKGRISCSDERSANFTFVLKSRVPPKGHGKGTTNKGEPITFVLGN